MEGGGGMRGFSAEDIAKERGKLRCEPMEGAEGIDKAGARRKMASLGVEIDEMSETQKEYLGI